MAWIFSFKSDNNAKLRLNHIELDKIVLFDRLIKYPVVAERPNLLYLRFASGVIRQIYSPLPQISSADTTDSADSAARSLSRSWHTPRA